MADTVQSSNVIAGINGTVDQYNNLRADMLSSRARAFVWYLEGQQIVANEVGIKYIAPKNMTAKKIWFKTGSGTATLRIQKGTTDINSGMSASDTLGSDDSLESAAISAGDIITLDITACSAGTDIIVCMECLQD